MLEKLELTNFTTFSNLEITFVPGVNVIIGENATGKTHLLKAGYALSCAQKFATSGQEARSELPKLLLSLFRPRNENLGQLCQFGSGGEAFIRSVFSTDSAISASFSSRSRTLLKKFEHHESSLTEALPPIFIPTKEVLSFVNGITSTESDTDTLTRLFDATYFHISHNLIQASGENAEKLSIDPRLGTILPKITELLGGRYEFTDGGLMFQPGSYVDRRAREQYKLGDKYETLFKSSIDDELAGSMTAEGFRKLGIIQQLLRNQRLVPGLSGPIFWDEPEANMNPQLIRFLVTTLLDLARNGQQVIIATHNYVVLKWLDLLCEESFGDHVRYFSLYRDSAKSGVQHEQSDSYVQLRENSVGETYSELYDKQIDKVFES